jgi:hypothetical protein
MRSVFPGLPPSGGGHDKWFMLIHSVFFWLKPETTAAQHEAMHDGLESLRGITSVEALYIGVPAVMPARPVRESSYVWSLTVVFKDIAAHDAYQIDPLHEAFNQNFRPLWSRVQVYDAIEGS